MCRKVVFKITRFVKIMKRYNSLPSKVALKLLCRFPGCVILDEESANLIAYKFLAKSKNKIITHQFDKLCKSSIFSFLNYFVLIARIIVLTILFMFFTQTVNESFFSFFSSFTNENDGLANLLTIVSTLLFIFFMTLLFPFLEGVAVCIHELLHVLGHSHTFYVTHYGDNVTTLSCFTLKWKSKSAAMLSMIQPLATFMLIGLIVYIYTDYFVLSLFIILTGVSHASSDISKFFAILLFVPRRTLSFGHYFVMLCK